MTLLFQPSDLSDDLFNSFTRHLYGCWAEALYAKALPATITVERIHVSVPPRREGLFRRIPGSETGYIRVAASEETAYIVSIAMEEFCRENGLTFSVPLPEALTDGVVQKTVIFKL